MLIFPSLPVHYSRFWTGAENLAPKGIRSPDRQARRQSLYRLTLPGPLFEYLSRKFKLLLLSDKMPGTVHEYLVAFIIRAKFFLELEMFLSKSVEKIKTQILYPVRSFFSKIALLITQCGKKYLRARQTTDDNTYNTARAHSVLDN